MNPGLFAAAVINSQKATNAAIRRARGAGVGREPEDRKWHPEDIVFFGFFGLIILGLVIMIAVTLYQRIDRDPISGYQVPGTVVGYTKSSGKGTHVIVHLQQHDGKVRPYSTDIHPSDCRYAPLGTNIPVNVEREQSSRTKEIFTKSVDLVYNPCK